MGNVFDDTASTFADCVGPSILGEPFTSGLITFAGVFSTIRQQYGFVSQGVDIDVTATLVVSRAGAAAVGFNPAPNMLITRTRTNKVYRIQNVDSDVWSFTLGLYEPR